MKKLKYIKKSLLILGFTLISILAFGEEILAVNFTLTPNTADFKFTNGDSDTDPTSVSITLKNTNIPSVTLHWTGSFTDGADWLSASVLSGSLEKKGDSIIIDLTIDTSKIPNLDFGDTVAKFAIQEDGVPSNIKEVTVTLLYNKRPVFTSHNYDTTTEGTTDYSFTVEVDDTNEVDVITASNVPIGALFKDNKDNTGTLTWQNIGFSAAENSPYSIIFTAKDTLTSVDTNFILTVNNFNSAPVLTLDPPGDQSIDEGDTLLIKLSATDPQSDSLSFTIVNKPDDDDAVFTDSSNGKATFEWITDFNDSGSYNNIIFTVRDDSLIDADTINITVTNLNRPPVIQFNTPATVNTWDSVSYPILDLSSRNPHDDDGDNYSWKMTGDTTRVTFSESENKIQFLTNNYKDNTFGYVFKFYIEDVHGAVSKDSIQISVNQVKIEFDSTNFGLNLVDRQETIKFTISNQSNTTVDFNSITPFGAGLTYQGNIGDLNPGSPRIFDLLWKPTSIRTFTNDSLRISANGFPIFTQTGISGDAREVKFSPSINPVNFGYVNCVDRRLAKTSNPSFENAGNITVKLSDPKLSGTSASSYEIINFSPPLSDSLKESSSIDVSLGSKIISTGRKDANLTVDVSVDLGNTTYTYNDKIIFNITGNGESPLCEIYWSGMEEDDSLRFGVTDINISKTKSFYILNHNNVDFYVDSLSFNQPTSLFTFDSEYSDTIIKDHDSNKINIIYTPQETGIDKGSVSISSLLDPKCPNVPFSGSGRDAKWAITGAVIIPSLDHCDSILNSFSLKNGVGDSVNIDSLRVNPRSYTNQFVFNETMNDIGVRNGGEFTRNYKFTPTSSTEDTIPFSIDIYFYDPVLSIKDSSQQVFLNAEITAPLISRPLYLDFDSVELGTSKSLPFTVQNNGNGDLNIYNIESSSGEITSFITSLYIKRDSSRIIELEFSPSSYDGERTDTLRIIHNSYESCNKSDSTYILLSGYGVDSKPPVIIDPPTYVNGDLCISIADSGVGVQAVQAFYWFGNQPIIADSDQEKNMNLEGTQYCCIINDNRADTTGLVIKVVFSDKANNRDSSEIIDALSKFDSEDFVFRLQDWVNSTDTFWHLVSIPCNYTSQSVANIFNELGQSDGNDRVDGDHWRIYDLDSVDQFDKIHAKHLKTNSNSFIEPGKGYLIRQFLGDTAITLPEGTTIGTYPAFEITLNEGWNIIGNPYLFDFTLNSSDIPSISITQFLKEMYGAKPGGTHWLESVFYDSTEPKDYTTLEVGKGYFVFSPDNGLTILLDPHSQPDMSPASPKLTNYWQMNMNLIGGGNKLEDIYIGINPKANDGLDLYDTKQLSISDNSSLLGIIEADGFTLYGDIRSSDSLQIWDIFVSPSEYADLKLTWNSNSSSEDNKSLTLHDALENNMIDMQDVTSYQIPFPYRQPKGRFKILYGQKSEIELAAQSTELLPTSYKLYQNYPNPFNPNTVIMLDLPKATNVDLSIYNILGQKVTNIVNSSLGIGTYEFEWNSNNSSGKKVASGIYFARLLTDDYSETIKMTLIK